MNNNDLTGAISAEIIKGTSKAGTQYKAVQFSIMTSQGEYKSPLCFPTSLEVNLIEQALNPFGPVYSSQEN